MLLGYLVSGKNHPINSSPALNIIVKENGLAPLRAVTIGAVCDDDRGKQSGPANRDQPIEQVSDAANRHKSY